MLLTGAGGDELFWGYDWVMHSASTNQLLSKKPSLRTLTCWAGSSYAQRRLAQIAAHPRVPTMLRRWAKLFRSLADVRTPKEQLSFYMEESNFSDAFNLKKNVYGNAMQALRPEYLFMPSNIGPRSDEAIPAAIIRLLFDTWMVSNVLALGDRLSMSVGVEARSPFLDVCLIEKVMALRSQKPDHKLGQKSWLRASLQGVLPDEVLARPKAGFRPPVETWLAGVVAAYGHILRDGELVKAGIVNGARVEHILTFMSKEGGRGLFFTYKLVLLEMWCRKVMLP